MGADGQLRDADQTFTYVFNNRLDYKKAFGENIKLEQPLCFEYTRRLWKFIRNKG